MCTTDLLRQVRHLLFGSGIPQGEASALAMMLLEETTRLTRTQILTGSANSLPVSADEIMQMARRIASGTPIQYVLGYADFCGLRLKVTPSVLIPRPETAELVQWTIDSAPSSPRILDIGTGSGCIALALANALPGAQADALDISAEALEVARQNAAGNHLDIHFIQADILNCSLPRAAYDIIISNPPYICESEAAEMQECVLAHEPHKALFVPDTTPLLFYQAIATRALDALRPGGFLFFEINRQYGSEMESLLHSLGFQNIELRKDQFDNPRMIKAINKKCP